MHPKQTEPMNEQNKNQWRIMATDLNALTTNSPKRPRITLYGPAGTGKTTFAAQAPNPIFILTEDGLGDIPAKAYEWDDPDANGGKRKIAKTFDEVMEAISQLYIQDHQFKTVVLDTLDWLEPLIWDRVCDRNRVSSIEDVRGGFGKGYVDANHEWEKLLDGLTALRDKKDMFVIMIAHSDIKTINDPQVAAYDSNILKLNKRAAALCTEYPDIVGFVSFQVLNTTDDDKRTRGVTTGRRILSLSPKPAFTAKNRFHMPDEITLLWSEFEANLPKFGETTIHMEVKNDG